MPRGWLLVVLLAAGCNAAVPPSGSAEAAGIRGGTLRVGVPLPPDAVEGWQVAIFDPQFPGGTMFRCCLLRTLLTYNGRSFIDGGAELLPDLAEHLPEVTRDGLTWTFRLKDGLRYAPPFDERPILARDFITALERTVRVGFASHYDIVEGVAAFRAGEAGTISGAQASDDRTLIFHLREPAGDFGNRVAMTYLAPIPDDAIRLHDEEYPGFLVASGPYMIEAAESLDHADPEADPFWHGMGLGAFALVRNPSWSSSSDPIRPAYADRIEVVPFATSQDVDRAVLRGEIDVAVDPLLPESLTEVVADPALRSRLHEAPLSALFFIPLNVAQPPFDDVAVRRAVNAVLDREALISAVTPRGGSAWVPLTHAFPDIAVAGLLRDYEPATLGAGDDTVLARQLMAGSSYDTNADGRCDGDACHVTANPFRVTEPEVLEIIAQNLLQLGIRVTWVEVEQPEDVMEPEAHIGFAAIFGWIIEYPSATDVVPLFTKPGLGSVDLSLVGASSEQLESWGYEVTSVPSVDDKIAACRPRLGSAAFACWAELDQLLSEQVVPWAPIATPVGAWLVSDRVDRFDISGPDSQPALERMSLRANANDP